MRFEEKYGEQIIVLEENDSISIKTPDTYETIRVSRKGDKVNIDGGAELINSISGKGMLEKIYIPPVVSSKDLIKKCDKWFEIFKQTFDKFKELVLSDSYKEQKISMHLDFVTYSTLGSSERGRGIDLKLSSLGSTVQKGVSISIDEDNEDMYQYLVALVMDYYLSTNYEGVQIDMINGDFNGILYDGRKYKNGTLRPMITNINCLLEDHHLYDIVTGIIKNHNTNKPSTQIIDNLRDVIANQRISSSIDHDLEQAERQLQYIVGDEPTGPMKKLVPDTKNKNSN